jgi:hypothetical protein
MAAGVGPIFHPNHFRHGLDFCYTRPGPDPLPSLPSELTRYRQISTMARFGKFRGARGVSAFHMAPFEQFPTNVVLNRLSPFCFPSPQYCIGSHSHRIRLDVSTIFFISDKIILWYGKLLGLIGVNTFLLVTK